MATQRSSIRIKREMSALSKFLPIKSIKPNGFSYQTINDMMLSDKTKSAPHQVNYIKTY